jgi:hypothetical protein
MMRARVTCLVASCALAVAAPAFAQTADVQDLGHGIYRAAGVMGGTAVRVPQSKTSMIVTRDGNVIVDTSIAAAASAHKRALHDATVKGMNEGKSVLTLMQEITIYEGYVGWYDGNVSTMFGPSSQAYEEVVKLAGGPDTVAARARQLIESDAVRALYLADMALAVDGRHRAALEARLAALRWLDAHSGNSNERGWLAAGIRDAEARLKQ